MECDKVKDTFLAEQRKINVARIACAPHNKAISESTKRQHGIQTSLTDNQRKRLRLATRDASVFEEAGATTREEVAEKVWCAVHTSSAS